jgi:hypothetical protein
MFSVSLAAASLANVNLLGISEHLGGGGIGLRFGWPLAFLWKDYANSSAWLFGTGSNIDFHPISLIVNAMVSLLITAGTAYWVESVCRESSHQSRFTIQSLLAITAWAATFVALKFHFDVPWFSFVRYHLEFVLLLAIGAFWFGFFRFLAQRLGRTRST